MPIASSGVYTPPTGAEDATPGEVIRSATWNSIFTDLSSALTQLAKGTFVPTPRTASTGSFTVAAADTVVLVTAPAATIVLPLSSTKTGIVKIMGAASTIFGGTNSLIIATSPDTISGHGTITLTTNYQVVVLYPLSSGGYIVD